MVISNHPMSDHRKNHPGFLWDIQKLYKQSKMNQKEKKTLRNLLLISGIPKRHRNQGHYKKLNVNKGDQ